MIIKTLKSFGLNDNEARTYLAALELGESNIQRISNKAKIKRTTTYDVIESLKEKGLISSTIKNKKRYFIASDPREFEMKLEERKRNIQSIIPNLLSIANIIDNKPKIRFYEGEEGIKEVYLDTLKYPDSPIWAWVTEDVWQVLDQDFIDYYLSQRLKKKIWAYVIAPNKNKLHKYKSDDAKFLRQTRINSDTKFSVEVEIDLYADNKIGIMAFKEKIGLIIESQIIFNTLKNIFDSAWENLE